MQASDMICKWLHMSVYPTDSMWDWMWQRAIGNDNLEEFLSTMKSRGFGGADQGENFPVLGKENTQNKTFLSTLLGLEGGWVLETN